MQTNNLKPQKVFEYFNMLSAIPHGSGDMDGIASFCESFAKEHEFKYIRDNNNNVIIFKNGTAGYEKCEPIILQGHLDMVCQKTPESSIDFTKDGLDLYIDGDFVKAKGTTLGADNGIAVAMVLAILDSADISHPPIEAVFTTDEETGMIGARALDMSVLRGKRMINLDSETENIVTVSCAGGSDFRVNIPIVRSTVQGTKITLDIKGLQGGHSGVDIKNNRENANMIAGRVLNELKSNFDFDIISINGGDKSNAIPNRCIIELSVSAPNEFITCAEKYFDIIRNEISDREPDFKPNVSIGEAGEFDVFTSDIKEKIIYTLLCVPNGITEMSAEIKGLVQTSLNLGILVTNEQNIILHFALRSNKKSALLFLEQRLMAFFNNLDLKYETFGHYPPWEYKSNSPLRELYCNIYFSKFDKNPKITAIHAGLECGVFSNSIKDLDCISIGPNLYDVHTVRERLSISSTQNLYNMVVELLGKLK